jgi:predicted secreted Zn-dependent protease
MRPADSGAAAELTWRTARSCDAGTCVQVARKGDTVLIRDSKNVAGPVLTYSGAEWDTFVQGIRQGDFDDLL